MILVAVPPTTWQLITLFQGKLSPVFTASQGNPDDTLVKKPCPDLMRINCNTAQLTVKKAQTWVLA